MAARANPPFEGLSVSSSPRFRYPGDGDGRDVDPRTILNGAGQSGLAVPRMRREWGRDMQLSMD